MYISSLKPSTLLLIYSENLLVAVNLASIRSGYFTDNITKAPLGNDYIKSNSVVFSLNYLRTKFGVEVWVEGLPLKNNFCILSSHLILSLFDNRSFKNVP